MPSLEDLAAFLKADFARLVTEHGVPGASIAVLKDGEYVEAAAGVLSTATGVAATADSVFQIGSITKLWTATLVMQLVDDGLLDLDAPVRRYLPEFRLGDEAAAAAITARQLLSHQGGFEGDVFTDTGRGEDAIEKYLASLAGLPQVFPPGELFSYNNAAYIVLGRLVEVLRDTSWETALVERIATPLGLTHLAPSPYEAILFRAAVGHLGAGADGVATPAAVWALARSNEPAGSMLAMRARDLAAFARMHLEGGLATDGTRVLSEASVREMQEAQVRLPRELGGGAAWGLGWQLLIEEPSAVLGHDGGTLGQSAFLRVHPGTGLVVALFANGGDPKALFQGVVARILREAAGVEPSPAPQPPAEAITTDVAPLLGRYSNSTLELIVSAEEGGRLWLESIPKGVLAELGEKPTRVELVALGPDALITVAPAGKDLHAVYSFFGTDGRGRRRYLHYGRALARAD